MRNYRILVALLGVFWLLMSSAMAGVSDSERIHNFDVVSKNLAGRLDAAISLEVCEELKGEIFRLRDDYTQYRELIDFNSDGTFDSRIRLLFSRLDLARERIKKEEERKATQVKLVTAEASLVVAAQKNETLAAENVSLKAQIETLVGEIVTFNTRIAQLSEENGNLEKEIQVLKVMATRSQEANVNLEKDLKALRAAARKSQETIDQLKSVIRDRDDLIVKLMESLNQDFAKAALPAGEKEALALRINSDRFQDTMLTTIKMNVDFLDSTSLEAADLQTLQQEQRKFAARWAALKPAIAKLYGEDQAKRQALDLVDGRIAAWQGKIDETIWKRLHQVLASHDIPVSAFANATEFQANLSKYIDEQLLSPSGERYRAFQEVWEKEIRANWLAILPANQALTPEQLAAIDNRIALWADRSSHTPAVVMWGFGLSGVLVLLSVIVWWRRRKSIRRRSGQGRL